MDIISILTWVSIISGGFLIFLLLFSIVGGLELDLDIGGTDVDTDADAGGLGVIKGALTFVSVSTWMMKASLIGNKEPWVAILIGLSCGLLAFWALNYFFRFLIRNEENVNWSMEDTRDMSGEVYLRIPVEGEGLVKVEVKGALRELKARTRSKKEIQTGDKVRVVDIENNYVIVESETV